MKKIVVIALLLLGQPAMAAMSLDKMIIHLKSTPNAREDIVVSNPDSETLYLQTEVFRVENPGTDAETLVPVTNPEEFKLLISPSKAVIEPGGKKRFRLMSIESGLNSEKVYRVTFRPVVGDIKTKATGVKILVAFQALVFVQPEEGRYSLSLEKGAQGWGLKNNGSINVEVSKLRYCPQPEHCEEVDVKGRIYPGTDLGLNISRNEGTLDLRAYDGETSEAISIPLK